MRRTLIVFRKEFRSALNTPPAYVFVILFLVFSSVWLFFARGFFARGQASLRPYFEIMPALLAVLMPALTMRSWAEEKRTGTYEFLMTLPFRPGELVTGKYLSAMAVACSALVLSLSVPLSVFGFGDFDAGVVFTEYLGILAMTSACAALGQFVSSRTKNQVSAFLVSAVILLILSLAGRIPALASVRGFPADALAWISLTSHFDSFARGVLDSRDIAYFLLVTATFLYLTSKHLRTESWR